MQQNKNNKRKTPVVAAILALLLLLTGTFAWQSISQQALNAAKSDELKAGGRLHDDFEMIDQWDYNTTANKDIYVENFEDKNNGRDIFVRVRLYEYMEIGEGANLNSSDTGFATRQATPIVAGTDRQDLDTWTPWAPKGKPSEVFRSYWDWNMNGESKIFMPTFNKDRDSKATDIKGAAKDPQFPSNTSIYNDKAGEHDFFAPAGTPHTEAGVTHTSKSTLATNVPIMMADWKQLSDADKIANRWVIDEDGWAYWSAPLSPGEATNLLLSDINLKKEIEDEWYYGIHVKAQMATAGDWRHDQNDNGGFFDGKEDPSKDGEDLLNWITGHSTVTGVRLTPETSNFIIGDAPLQLSATVNGRNLQNATGNDAVDWRVSPNSGATITQTGKFDATVVGTYTVTVKAKADASKMATAVVEVKDVLIKGTPDEGNHIEINGEEFQVLKDLGSGNRLIIRRHVLETNSVFRPAGSYISYHGSTLESRNQSYYAGLSAEFKSIVQPVSNSFSTQAVESMDTDTLHLTQVVPNGVKTAFALSVADVNTSRVAWPTPGTRTATRSNGTAQQWWLRSATTTASTGARLMFTNGDLGWNSVNTTTVAVRPALVIHVNQ